MHVVYVLVTLTLDVEEWACQFFATTIAMQCCRNQCSALVLMLLPR